MSTLPRRRVLARLLALSGVASSACTPPRTDSLRPDGPRPALVWPSPPAQPRYRYVATLRSSADLGHGDEQELSALLGVPPADAHRLSKPFAVAAGDGRIYVTDTALRHVQVFDLPRRRSFQFGFRREGTLVKPLGLCVDRQRRVYVADATARRVVAYDALGLFRIGIGNREELRHPVDCAVSNDGRTVFVVDMGGLDSADHRIVVYDANGRRRDVLGQRGTGPREFNLPVGIAVAPDDTLYVLDAGNFRVQALTADGGFKHAFGGPGRGYGQFARPKSISVDDRGLVYVADAAFGNVQVFDAEGRLLLPLGTASRIDTPGRYGLLSSVATDERGHLYLLDQAFTRVDVIERL